MNLWHLNRRLLAANNMHWTTMTIIYDIIRKNLLVKLVRVSWNFTKVCWQWYIQQFRRFKRLSFFNYSQYPTQLFCETFSENASCVAIIRSYSKSIFLYARCNKIDDYVNWIYQWISNAGLLRLSESTNIHITGRQGTK